MSRRRKNNSAVGYLALIAVFIGMFVLLIKFMKLEKPFIYIAIGLLIVGLIVSFQFDSEIGMTVFFLSIVPMALYSDHLRRQTGISSAITEFGSIAWIFAYFTFLYH